MFNSLDKANQLTFVGGQLVVAGGERQAEECQGPSPWCKLVPEASQLTMNGRSKSGICRTGPERAHLSTVNASGTSGVQSTLGVQSKESLRRSHVRGGAMEPKSKMNFW